jgi:hypothetical protein
MTGSSSGIPGGKKNKKPYPYREKRQPGNRKSKTNLQRKKKELRTSKKLGL